MLEVLAKFDEQSEPGTFLTFLSALIPCVSDAHSEEYEWIKFNFIDWSGARTSQAWRQLLAAVVGVLIVKLQKSQGLVMCVSKYE